MSKESRFNQLAERFCDRIYGKEKGRIRLARLWASMNDHIPGLSMPHTPFSSNTAPNMPLEIIDLGGGAGHMSLLLCELGHRVTLVEPAADMVELAHQRLSDYLETGQVTIVSGNLFTAFEKGQISRLHYDLVVFHAVLEWLPEPSKAYPYLKQALKPGGYLSLMFYNRNAIAIKNLLKGNFYRVKRAALDGGWGGDPGSLTPISPLNPEEVYAQLIAEGFILKAKTGIRSFYDYMPKKVQQSRSREDVIELEALFSEQEPFISMSRYIHVVAHVPAHASIA